MTLKNKVQLITYPDSLGADLKSLNEILLKYFPDVFKGGVHILPPFPSSGDRGFAPITYLEIDPRFGTWNDIKAIGENFDIIIDLMVNHISKQSKYFKDFLKKGRKSEYADLFITLNKIWSDGNPIKEDIDKMFLRRKEPYSTFTIEETNKEEKVWTTFGKTIPSEQIDLDINSEKTKELLKEFFMFFSKNNIKIVRLDAVGYIIKKLGTSCFFVEPNIYDFIDWIRSLADSQGIELLPEVHAHYSTQFKLAQHGCFIYDFVLPFTILHTLINKTSKKLYEYLKIRPSTQFTMLDCHDGIPVIPDLNDLIDTKEAGIVVQKCVDRGALLSKIITEEYKAEDGFDVHQIDCTYYSALGCDDNLYLAARAIQFFVPGIPQVYYVGLLAGKNDYSAVKKTGENRDINRHNYTVSQIENSINNSVVQRLLKLIKFRNEYEAFNGQFTILQCAERQIALSWQKEKWHCKLNIELEMCKSVIYYINENDEEIEYVV